MRISIIVPLSGEKEDTGEACRYLQYYATYQTVKEIIFISTKDQCSKLAVLDKEPKVKTLRFAGASKAACLEAGAFEATGDILLFLNPGTFPRPHFDQLILESLQNNNKAGVFAQVATDSVWNKIMAKLPLRCALCFMRVNNFFTTRHLFHLKSRQLSRHYSDTFKQVFHRYAISFKATLI
ncbi:hypothetical protein ACFSRY_18145 [Pontibacter locisalis]|uniref:Glycosyl transferase family 2 n=1 Tax=Pontibacter locisalis TaxID=1719035 RepID=A0ABW5IQZ3_9BACT